MDLGLVAKLYNVDVRQAVLWSIESWNALSKTTFVDCWKKTGLLEYYTCEYAGPDEEDGITEELTAMISRLHTSNPMSGLELLNPPEENVLMEDPTDEDFCRVEDKHDDENRCGAVGDGANTVDDENEAAFVAPTPDNLTAEELKERLRWMAQLFVSADAMGVSSGTVCGLRSMQRAFREEFRAKAGSKAAKVDAGLLRPSFSKLFSSIVKHLRLVIIQLFISQTAN